MIASEAARADQRIGSSARTDNLSLRWHSGDDRAPAVGTGHPPDAELETSSGSARCLAITARETRNAVCVCLSR